MVQHSGADRVNSASGSVDSVSSAYVETYWTPGGKDQKKAPPQKRYRVRCRHHMNVEKTQLLHLGSFQKRSDAEARAEIARSLLARGIVPNPDTNMITQAERSGLTVSTAIRRYLNQRPDLADESKRSYLSLMKHIDRALGKRDVATITPNDVRELVAACSHLSAAPVSSIRSILAGGLDNAGIEPNPALHRSIKLPVRASERIDVPPLEHVAAILQRLPEHLLVPVAMIEATGARVSELAGVEHADVDHSNLRLRLIGKGDKPRMVPMPPELAARIPRGAGRVWPRAAPHAIRRAMRTACIDARIPHYHPHDLRHRYASRLVQQGVPITQISAWMGHSRTSITLDVYADIIGDVGEAWREVIHE